MSQRPDGRFRGNASPGRSRGARIALHAGPLLAPFNAAGVLAAADVHVARRLGRLAGEGDERVLLAVALAVRAVRAGSVCVDLDDLDRRWRVPRGRGRRRRLARAALARAGGVAGRRSRPARSSRSASHGPPDRPGALGRRPALPRPLLAARAGRSARAVDAPACAAARRRSAPALTVAAAVAPAASRAADDARQRLAAATAALSRLTVLTGGPGTGKTTTVARLLAVLQTVAGPGLRVALAAPTGKAAARLQEAVRAEVARPGRRADRAAVGEPEATTLHRLLGLAAGQLDPVPARPRPPPAARRRRRRRDLDGVAAADGAAARGAAARRPGCVLVGDPDQLASVEAGAVLGDLVARPPGRRRGCPPRSPPIAARHDLPHRRRRPGRALRNGVVRLETVHRFSGADIGRPRRRRSAPATPTASSPCCAPGAAAVAFVETAGERLDRRRGRRRPPRRPSRRHGAGRRRPRRRRRRPRCAPWTRTGCCSPTAAARPASRHWAAQVEALGAPRPPGPTREPSRPWYPGRPLLVTGNDRDTGLYNGDTGVVVARRRRRASSPPSATPTSRCSSARTGCPASRPCTR